MHQLFNDYRRKTAKQTAKCSPHNKYVHGAGNLRAPFSIARSHSTTNRSARAARSFIVQPALSTTTSTIIAWRAANFAAWLSGYIIHERVTERKHVCVRFLGHIIFIAGEERA
jgi:hypothetical protein